jgi:hypothetical protein
VGSRDIGAGLKLTVWALDPDHCEVVLPGWPKTIANWTGEPDLARSMSSGAAIAIDEIGNLAIGGNLIVNGKTQPYVALLTSDGARLWEKDRLGRRASSPGSPRSPASSATAGRRRLAAHERQPRAHRRDGLDLPARRTTTGSSPSLRVHPQGPVSCRRAAR